MGLIVHRVEVVGGSEAQNTRDLGWCKTVLSGPAKGGGENPVSGAGTEVEADFAQANGGIAPNGALFVLGLQLREELHQLHGEVGLI